MAFLGGFINAVTQMFTSVKKAAKRSFEQFDIKPTRKSNTGVSMSLDISDAVATAFAAVKAVDNPYTQKELYEDIGKRGVEIVKEELRPITRSGKTAEGFSYRFTGEGVEIYSNDPQAAALQEGISGVPPRDKLYAWLKTKSEHSGKEEKELQRLAFLIQRSIAKKKPTGNMSTLKHLSPTGKRAYDYVGRTTERLTKEVNNALEGFNL